MANKKISALTALTEAAAADVLPIVDDSASETKKITFANLAGGASKTELGYVHGVTSAIQTQLAAKQPLDTALTNISALTYVSPSFIKLTAEDTYAVRTLAETLSDIGAEPVKGADDNYVTDAEKSALHAAGSDTSLGSQSENLDMNTHKIVGVVDPTTDQEAATKKYVDDNHPTVPVKATGAEVDTGTDDAKFATPKALADSKYFKSDETKTLTNKRITARVKTFASDATPDVDSDDYDAVTITAQAVAITDVNVTGTPTNFQKLIFRILDNGTARAITWGSDFQAMGVALPTTTTASKVLTVGFIYDTVDSKWGCVAVADEENMKISNYWHIETFIIVPWLVYLTYLLIKIANK